MVTSWLLLLGLGVRVIKCRRGDRRHILARIGYSDGKNIKVLDRGSVIYGGESRALFVLEWFALTQKGKGWVVYVFPRIMMLKPIDRNLRPLFA